MYMLCLEHNPREAWLWKKGSKCNFQVEHLIGWSFQSQSSAAMLLDTISGSQASEQICLAYSASVDLLGHSNLGLESSGKIHGEIPWSRHGRSPCLGSPRILLLKAPLCRVTEKTCKPTDKSLQHGQNWPISPFSTDKTGHGSLSSHPNKPLAFLPVTGAALSSFPELGSDKAPSWHTLAWG